MTDARRPTRTETLLHIADVISRRSTCTRLSVGALIAREGRILTTGYNGPPAGMAHCKHECDCGGKAGFAENHWPACAALRACSDAVHAEANAVAFAARYGMATDGAEMYTTHAPCGNCAKLIVNAGIIKVAYSHTFRDTSGVELLRNAGIGVA